MNPIARRQLLPKDSQTNSPLPNVDPHAGFRGENYYGIFGTARPLTMNLEVLFVGVGAAMVTALIRLLPLSCVRYIGIH